MPALLAAATLANTIPLRRAGRTALALAVIRVGRTGDCRWWLAAGLITGLGLANKHSIGLFVAAVIAGVLLSSAATLSNPAESTTSSRDSRFLRLRDVGRIQPLWPLGLGISPRRGGPAGCADR